MHVLQLLLLSLLSFFCMPMLSFLLAKHRCSDREYSEMFAMHSHSAQLDSSALLAWLCYSNKYLSAIIGYTSWWSVNSGLLIDVWCSSHCHCTSVVFSCAVNRRGIFSVIFSLYTRFDNDVYVVFLYPTVMKGCLGRFMLRLCTEYTNIREKELLMVLCNPLSTKMPC